MNKELNNYSDEDYLSGIFNGDKPILARIYASYFQQVKKLIVKNQGTEADAKDIFQEALLAIYIDLRARDKNGEPLIIRKSFAAFLTIICKRRWLNELKRRKKFVDDPEDLKLIADEEQTIKEMAKSERKILVWKHINRLEKTCRAIIELLFDGKNLREIAEKLELNYAYVRRRAPECNRILSESIRNDPWAGDFI